ncbi:MAG TPA: ABC transporter substrate-binding protein [Thermoanaerobaculia bacterium]|nr:ABC transporter substrate-binding protein [Thermoanaerobaculia bacterium]
MIRAFLKVSAAAALLVTACQAPRGEQPAATVEDIPVGVYLSLTGSEATFGNETLEGIRMAADEINSRGGVLGKKLRLVVEDDQGKPEEAASVVTKMITSDRVLGMIGENKSACSLAAAPICQAARVPMVSPSSTNPEVTKKGDYIFRVCFIDSLQGDAIASYAVKSLKATKAAIIKDVKSDYSVGLGQFFAQGFAARGGKVVADQSYSEGDRDFRSQLTAIRNAKPDVIMVPGYYTDVAQIAIQARDLGLTIPLIGGDGWESPKLLEIAGSSLDGSYYASPVFFSDKGSPAMATFISSFRKRYGKEPAALNAQGYDALNVFAEGVRRAGTLDPPAIRKAIAETKDFQGAAGVLTLNENRDAVKPVSMVKIVGKTPTFAGWVEP